MKKILCSMKPNLRRSNIEWNMVRQAMLQAGFVVGFVVVDKGIKT